MSIRIGQKNNLKEREKRHGQDREEGRQAGQEEDHRQALGQRTPQAGAQGPRNAQGAGTAQGCLTTTAVHRKLRQFRPGVRHNGSPAES